MRNYLDEPVRYVFTVPSPPNLSITDMPTSGDHPRAYELSCNDCSFATEYEGDIDGLYDVVDSHQEEMQTDPADHFVDFESIALNVQEASD